MISKIGYRANHNQYCRSNGGSLFFYRRDNRKTAVFCWHREDAQKIIQKRLVNTNQSPQVDPLGHVTYLIERQINP